MGAIKPFLPQDAEVISCPFRIVQGSGKVYLNGADSAEAANSGFRIPIAWKRGDSIPPSFGKVRLQVQFAGIRPEDSALHAAYVTAS